MSLSSIGQVLIRAQQEHFAVPLFDVFDSLSIDGVFAAIEEKQAPVIVAIYTETLDHPNAHSLAEYIRVRASQSPGHAALILDHGGSFEHVMTALSWGFTDVMYDGSNLPLDENIANTRMVVRAAHALGVSVEAELGHVGHGSEYEYFGGQRMGFTEPEMVEKFVAETGVDFLAIAIGNAHGLYHGEPHLDIHLLRNIRDRVDIPLVLHGGTGISEEQFRAAIDAGIAKINIATDLYVKTTERISSLVLANTENIKDLTYFSITRTAVESFKERCGYYIDMFGATGKA